MWGSYQKFAYLLEPTWLELTFYCFANKWAWHACRFFFWGPLPLSNRLVRLSPPCIPPPFTTRQIFIQHAKTERTRNDLGNHVTCYYQWCCLLPISLEMLLHHWLFLVLTYWTIQPAIECYTISVTVVYLTIRHTLPSSRQECRERASGQAQTSPQCHNTLFLESKWTRTPNPSHGFSSASFLAETSVRSTRKLFISTIYKNIFWIKVSQTKII